MQVREAVQIAKKHLQQAFVDENIHNLGLEEVEFDELEDVWNITLGFSRPWSGSLAVSLGVPLNFADPRTLQRDYRVIRVRDDDGVVKSIRMREFAN